MALFLCIQSLHTYHTDTMSLIETSKNCGISITIIPPSIKKTIKTHQNSKHCNKEITSGELSYFFILLNNSLRIHRSLTLVVANIKTGMSMVCMVLKIKVAFSLFNRNAKQWKNHKLQIKRHFEN